ncbi:SH3 domain-binding protein 5 homolog isoform X2 [Anopheles albimanus]|uniref:SH3 domain-binding protein 5 homolog isoform X2 n=1 Tax=Anopheles albimanus TaxID=7167 RepID=UPI0016403674|nr:SH3 domain-binding protein 5 homolog isoform X2 [Anopheles albimanus]
MASTKRDSEEPEDSTELDPRIQIELENLNTATDDINKLEIELEEANSTFRILMNESTRRLKLSSKKLGSCIEKARPYYEALEKAKVAQLECQAATLKYQRANEIHAAAKETVALAEQRFMSNSHEWQFDNAWQEMLNHATIKVMDAEKQKAESGAEHQKKAKVFEEAEKKVQQLEERYHRSIQKSRPYFDEKQLCQEQLEAQKGRIQQLEQQIQSAKTAYSTALRNLEKISEEIHQQRGDLSQAAPSGPREPGVGAELSNIVPATSPASTTATSNGGHHYHPHHNHHHHHHHQQQQQQHHHHHHQHHTPYSNGSSAMPDISTELDKCEIHSVGSVSVTTSSAVSEKDPNEVDDDSDDYPTLNVDGEAATADDDLHLELLRQKVRTLAVRPVEGGDGQQQEQDVWEHELNATVDKLDHLMMMRECSRSSGSFGKSARNSSASPASTEAGAAAATTVAVFNSLPNTPKHQLQVGSGLLLSPATPPHEQQQQQQAIKMFKKLDPLPLANVSMYALPTYLSQATATSTGDDTVGAMIINPGQQNTLLTPMASIGGGEAHYGAAIKPKRKMSM